jgi:DNA-binding transcriptional MerR regulator
MLTIGQVSKLAGMSTRTIRHYELLKLVSSIKRGENNYRYYMRDVLPILERIRDLQSLGFTLEEIGQILPVKTGSIVSRLRGKLQEVNRDLELLTTRRQRLDHLISTLKTEGQSMALPEEERKLFMDTIREHAISGLKEKQCVDRLYLKMIEREASVYHGKEQSEFFEALRSCLDFARSQGLKIGPGRGYASSSLILFAMGVTDIDPVIEHLVPERMSLVPPEIHIDVEYGRGQMFVDYCRKISDGLTWGSIHAFKMPLIDIINNVRSRVGLTWDSLRVSDDDHAVLSLIARGDIDKIFLLDYSPNALVIKYAKILPDCVDGQKIKKFLTSQKIHSLRDVLNITALLYPSNLEKNTRMERYKQAKRVVHVIVS